MYRPASPRNASRPWPRGRGPLPSTRRGPLRNGGSRCERSICPIPPFGFPRSQRPLEPTPVRRPAILPVSREKRKWTVRSALRRERSRRRDGSMPRASTYAGSRCGICWRRGSSGAQDPPIAGMRARRGKSAMAGSMSRRMETGETGSGSREKWRGSRSPRPSPFSAGTDPGKWGGPSTPGSRPAAVRGVGKCSGSRFGRKGSRWVRRGCRAYAWKDASVRPTGRSPSVPRRPRCGSTER
jgi:hypothetical protein